MKANAMFIDIWDQVQYEAYTYTEPVTYEQWKQLVSLWDKGLIEETPYPLSIETVERMIKERLH